MTLDPVVTNPNLASWLPAQEHAGHNIGDTPTHVIFVELKDSAARPPSAGALGPS
jgi:hypothetical protein